MPIEDPRILVVATDLRQHGAAVIPHARALAMTLGAEVHLLHVIPEPTDTEGVEEQARRFLLLDAVDREIRSEWQKFEDDPIPCRFEVKVGGDPGEVLREYAAEVDATAMITHPHHHGLWERLWTTSVTEQLLRHPEQAVLADPAGP